MGADTGISMLLNVPRFGPEKASSANQNKPTSIQSSSPQSKTANTHPVTHANLLPKPE